MIKNFFIAFCVCLLSVVTVFAQTRKYISHQCKNNELNVTTEVGVYRIVFYSDLVVENTFLPKGKKYNPISHAHEKLPIQKLKVIKSSSGLNVNTNDSSIQVKLSFNPFKLEYFYKNELLLTDQEGYKNISEKYEDECISLAISPTEKLMGGGARALGMNRRGNRLRLYNRAHYGYEERSELMNYTMPVVLSSKKYLLHFDNAQSGYLDLDSKKENKISFETIGGQMTYQLVAGNTWKEILKAYTNVLTGNQPLPPTWVFGNFASRFGYHSQKQTMEVVNAYDKDSIPLDAIILDLYWFGKDIKGTLGNFEFYKDSFPEPEKMIRDLHQKNLKLVLITEPFVLSTSKNWKEACDKKILATDSAGKPYTYEFYFGNTGLIDIYSESGKSWFWNQYRKLIQMGVDGFWGDLGEPEVHPEKLLHAKGKADEVHNRYGHDWARLVHEGYQKEFPNKRPFILMRSGYSGSQRFGIMPWSGDVNRTWGGLKPQTEISLQMGMQGIGYMHSDLGGFAGANDDRELYTRWLQYGVFQPIFRPHAQEEVASEPIYKDAETKSYAKKAIELRYMFFPYNYSLAVENHLDGTPLMRPFFMAEEDTSNYEISDMYCWGDDIFVVPITGKGQSNRVVHFPKGSRWYDWYSSKIYFGGSKVALDCEKDKIPFFVRGGAVVALAKSMNRISEFSPDSMQIHFFLAPEVKNQSKTIYFGEDYNKQQLKVSYVNEGRKVKVTFESPSNSGVTQIEVMFHECFYQPDKVLLNGKTVAFTYDKTLKKLQIKKLVLDKKINSMEISSGG
ncbi:MAG: TIM-barrel domain-containing protein [Bacteroidota bacterium]|jgi:oligosaccharide 4-alpha-D-glucosyltransferase